MYFKHCFLCFALVTPLFNNSLVFASPSTAESSFTLSAVHINQTSFIDSFKFFPFYKDYLGRKIQLSVIHGVCGDITKLYKAAGFLSVRCLLPPQKFEDGVVQLYVDEGVIAKVTVSGDVLEDDALIKSFVEQIELDQPLDIELLETIIMRLNSTPGIRVTTDIRAIPDTQTRELVFEVEATPFSGEFYLNNRGSKAIGPVQGGMQLIANSLFGRHEQVKLHLLTSKDSKELKYVELNTSWPVGNAGSSIEVAGSYVLSQPGDFLQPLEIEVDAVTGHLAWRKPFFISSKAVFSVTSGFDYFRSKMSFSEVELEFNELYKFKLVLDYVVSDSKHHNESSITFNHGLPDSNTTINYSNPAVTKGKEDFDSVKINYYYSGAVSNNFILSFQTQGQYAFTRLPVSEYIAFGGEAMGSAYDPAEFLGNHGLGGNFRVSYQFDNSLMSSSYTQFFTQYDVVKVWNDDSNISISGASLLVGLMFGAKNFHVDLQVAKPLTRDVFIEGNRDLRYFANVRYFF